MHRWLVGPFEKRKIFHHRLFHKMIGRSECFPVASPDFNSATTKSTQQTAGNTICRTVNQVDAILSKSFQPAILYQTMRSTINQYGTSTALIKTQTSLPHECIVWYFDIFIRSKQRKINLFMIFLSANFVNTLILVSFY